MAGKTQDTPQEPKPSKGSKLDLNALSELNFGPSWADESAKQSSVKQKLPDRDTHRRDKKPSDSGKRDRRSSLGGSQQRGEGSKGGRKPFRNRGDHGKDSRSSSGMFFEPTIKVDIYPQDEAFDALIKRLRSTVRTYQLFEIAHLILEKPERYNVMVQNKAKADEKPAPLYFSAPGHLPFETEEAAINHVLNNHLDLFFDIEEVEVEPPKGNFQMVNRCTVTGELLGPPNDHRYQGFLQRHYTSKINGMSFEQFVSKIETVKDQESIDAWVESMKKGARYTLKERKENEPESFESMEAVRMFLLQHRKDALVGSGETVRFAGRNIEQLPQGSLRRSVEVYIQQQIRFPLDTANNIRGRLRRHKFTVYKKGSKGISYVCAVKRKFRDSKTTFSPSIQSLIEFIEKHPNVSASELPKLHIGIDTEKEKQKPEKLEMDEAEVAAKPLETEKAPIESKDEADAPDAPEVAEASVADTEVTPVDTTTETELTTAESPSMAGLDEAAQKQLKQLVLDLRWLIFEGYVTEYGDGSLFAPPPMPETKPKETSKKDASAQADEPVVAENTTNDAESEAQSDETTSEEGQNKEVLSEEINEVADEVEDSPESEEEA